MPKLKRIQATGCHYDLCCAIKESLEGRKAVPIEEPQESAGRTRSSSRKRRIQSTFPPVTVFPALRTLHLIDADFRESRFPEYMDALIDMLMQRADMNAPIDSVILSDCRGVRSSYQKRRLGEVVANLEIDGEGIDATELGETDDYSDEESDYTDEEYDEEDQYSDDYDYDHPYFDYDLDDAFGWLPF
jgi:hypothetical protein